MTRDPVLVLSREDCHALMRLLELSGTRWTPERIRSYYGWDHAGAGVLAEIERAAHQNGRACCAEDCDGHE